MPSMAFRSITSSRNGFVSAPPPCIPPPCIFMSRRRKPARLHAYQAARNGVSKVPGAAPPAARASDSIEDVLKEANVLLALVGGGAAAGIAEALSSVDEIGYEYGASPQQVPPQGQDFAVLPTPLKGNGWSICYDSSRVSSSHKIVMRGESWAVDLTSQELQFVIEAALSTSRAVERFHEHGAWHWRDTPRAQTKVKNITAIAAYADAPSTPHLTVFSEPRLCLTIAISNKDGRVVKVTWPADAAASLLAALRVLEG